MHLRLQASESTTRMKIALFMALALAAGGAHAETAKVLLLNAGTMVIQVQADDRSVVAAIQPGTGATVKFNQPQWMRIGEKGYRYNTLPVMRLQRKGKEIVLQLGQGATLYLMHAGTTLPGSRPPPQPAGFPIRPNKIFSLR
jgi:apolipoprotein N-acyltransferase